MDYFLCDRLLCIFLQEFCGRFLRLGVPFSQLGTPFAEQKHIYLLPCCRPPREPNEAHICCKGARCYALQLIFTSMASQQEISHVPIAGNTNLTNRDPFFEPFFSNSCSLSQGTRAVFVVLVRHQGWVNITSLSFLGSPFLPNSEAVEVSELGP